MRSGAAAVSSGSENAPSGGSRVTSLASHGGRGSDAIEGAVALKHDAQHALSPTKRLEALQWSKTPTPLPQQGRTPRRSQAQRLRGRDVRRMREFHAGAEWDLHEVRYVWELDGEFVNMK